MKHRTQLHSSGDNFSSEKSYSSYLDFSVSVRVHLPWFVSISWYSVNMCWWKPWLGRFVSACTASEEATQQQKPVRENSAGDLVFSTALLPLHVVPPQLRSCHATWFAFYSLLLTITGLHRMKYRSIWNPVKATFTEGENAGVITDTVLTQ